jgi:hypothetical protein
MTDRIFALLPRQLPLALSCSFQLAQPLLYLGSSLLAQLDVAPFGKDISIKDVRVGRPWNGTGLPLPRPFLWGQAHAKLKRGRDPQRIDRKRVSRKKGVI